MTFNSAFGKNHKELRGERVVEHQFTRLELIKDNYGLSEVIVFKSRADTISVRIGTKFVIRPYNAAMPLNKLKVALFIFALCLGSLSPSQVKSGKCFNIGDTVTIRGRADAMVNGGTYFVPLDEFCAHFPKKTDHFTVRSLTTIGNKLPPNIYVEITGELRDLYASGISGIGIATTTSRDVDAEVKAIIAEAKRRCEQWQTENSNKLVERTHGGNVVREPQNLRGDDYTHNCAIWSVNTALPHELITIRRPVP